MRSVLENECGTFIRTQLELGKCRAVSDRDRLFGPQPQYCFVGTFADEERPVVCGLDAMTCAAVIESRLEDHSPGHLAANSLCATHQVVCVSQLGDCHEIGNFGDAAVGEKSSQQDVGIRQVELFVAPLALCRREQESPAFFCIE